MPKTHLSEALISKHVSRQTPAAVVHHLHPDTRKTDDRVFRPKENDTPESPHCRLRFEINPRKKGRVILKQKAIGVVLRVCTRRISSLRLEPEVHSWEAKQRGNCFWLCSGKWKFLDQGSNLCHSSDPRSFRDGTGSLNRYTHKKLPRCLETGFRNLFLASLLLVSMLKTPSCPAFLHPIFLLGKQSQCQ